MKRSTKRFTLVVAAALITMLVATSCGASPVALQEQQQSRELQNTRDHVGGGYGDIQDTEIRIFNTDPVRPLIPGDTNEWGGGRVVNQLFTGLVGYGDYDGAPVNAMAESIETTDSTVFTITIKDGWTFHDGTPVRAKNFVDAWNYTAYGPNQQRNNGFFDNIQGYADLNPVAAPGQPAPTLRADKLSGLEVLGPHRFRVTLNAPFSVFKTMLGYSAFYPLPNSFFHDPVAFAKHPIGNGPYKFVSAQHGVNQKVTAFEGYQGTRKPRIKDVTYTVFPTVIEAYQAVLDGRLDYLEDVPHDKIVSGAYKTELAGRHTDQDYLLLQALAFPTYLPGYDNPDLHKAVSMAIDRESIIKNTLGGTLPPADGWAIRGVDGYTPGQCGEFCTYNPSKAREHLARSGFTGPLKLFSNSESGSTFWAPAICRDVTANLGIGCEFDGGKPFRELFGTIVAKEMTGPYRWDWRADYPSIENFLNPIHRTGQSANPHGYSNPAFDAAMAEADSAVSREEANSLYQKAERMLAQDMPTIPLWQEWSTSGWSPRLKNVKTNIFTDLVLTDVQVVQPR